ncbi:MAG: M15 family metallopeptidase [bacterium]|nr:M15 family metallopeptidase [bacterium]
MATDKRKKIRFIVMAEIIAILAVINAVLVIHMDQMIGYENAKAQGIEEIQTERQKQALTGNLLDDQEESKAKEAKEVYQSEKESTLILVNKDHPIPDTYNVKKSTYIKQEKKVAAIILKPLEKMLADGEEKGFSFVVCSAYRSNEYQKNLFDKDLNKYQNQGMDYEAAYKKTALSVQPAGYSEHATGLAVDIISKENSKLDKTQEKTDEFKWLKTNCYKYGFILRYPDGKSEITGIIYEPWHFRYVGKKVAKFITKNNLTYEEFINLVNSAK